MPLTIIDSGVDLSHPEFSERPNTTALNPQTVTGNDEYHGTAVASVAAAPTNGVGLVGIYPQAKLQLWDASPKGEVTLGDEIAGIAAANKHGRGVINLSLGGQDRFSAEKDALMAAFGSGSLIVASVGNNRQAGSPALYPASFPHVLSVGATTERNRATSFSSASPALDLAAPGQDIPAAVPTYWSASGYATLNGTSFSAPLVSGAATAVWTARPKLQNTQLFDLIRFSARNVGNRSWNRDTGFGILNVAAAASRAPPSVDPQEPNEDVYLVKPNGLFRSGHASLTGPDHPHARLEARVERAKDPEDVYRAYLPAHGRLVVTVRPTANISLEVWGPRTKTVFERGAAARRDLLGVSARAGRRTERVTVRSRGTGAYVYVDVFLARKVFAAGYTMTVTSARR